MIDKSSNLSFWSESLCQQLRFISSWSNCNLPSFHRDFYAKDGVCEHCSSPCRTCEGNATNCHSCERDFVLDGGVCRETCPEKHVAVEGVCQHCPEMCQDCIHEKICKGTWKHPDGKEVSLLHKGTREQKKRKRPRQFLFAKRLCYDPSWSSKHTKQEI